MPRLGALALRLLLAVGTSSQAADVLSELLDPDLCDGFDFPVGDPDGKGSYRSPTSGRTYQGWYVAAGFVESYELGIHPGEDWNGSGGGDTDLGQPAHAIALGRVLFAAETPPPLGNIVVIRHRYIDNGRVRTVFSQYDHLREMHVKKGERVSRRQIIGTIGKGARGVYPAHLHLEIRKDSLAEYPPFYWPSSDGKDAKWIRQHYEAPSEFIRSRRSLLVPSREPRLLVVVKHDYAMHALSEGAVAHTYPIALSQDPVGPKLRQGDNRLPEGLYRICQKARGPFPTDRWQNAYFGPAWMRLSYPNADDARRGAREGLISSSQLRAILRAHERGETPPQDTPLGGGIGIHGWLPKDWSEEGVRDLTWGCVSMHNRDLLDLYERVAEGTPVIIAP